jgi:hypothetical protein
MHKKTRMYLVVGLVVVCSIILTWQLLENVLPAPPQKIIATVGIKNGVNELFAKQYQTILARSGITLEIHSSDGTGENLERLSDKKLNFQIGFATDRAIDRAPLKNILSMGQVSYLPYWIFYRSAKEWSDIDALKGKKIAIGAQATGRHQLAHALHLDEDTPLEEQLLSGEAATKALREGKVDAILISGTLNLPVIQDLLRDPSIRVLNFPRAEALTKIFPQLRHLKLPAGVVDFEKNIPSKDVNIIATSSSILIQEDLHPQIIYLLAQALEEVHGGFGPFHNIGTFPTQYDVGYPMSSAAREYYKNGPSFLNRYLPFWMTNYMIRILATVATVMAIVFPLLKSITKIYNWFIRQYTDRLFQRLRVLHIALNKTTNFLELQKIESDLNHIDRAAHILPMRHTDLYFSLIARIENERNRLQKNMPQ